MRHISTEERRSRLAYRQALAVPGASVGGVAEGMVGLHSSDPATVYLSLQARLPEFGRGDLEAALYENRTLLRLLGMRRTMFVVPRRLGSVINAACARPLAPAEYRRTVRMVEEAGIADDGAAWVDGTCEAVLAALAARGEAGATELREVVPALKEQVRFGEGKKWGGAVGMSTRILFLLAADARIIRGQPRGSWVSSQYRWATTNHWLGGSLPAIEEDAARADLLRRWLYTFGPGTFTDIKWWTGWNVGPTREALAACDAVEVELDDGTGFVLPDDVGPGPPMESWAALLPALDPTPMGWKERNWYLGEHGPPLFDRNGNVGPTVWSDGRIVGGWGLSSSGEVTVELLEKVGRDSRRLIENSRERLAGWLGDDRFAPRFPTPLQKKIAAE